MKNLNICAALLLAIFFAGCSATKNNSLSAIKAPAKVSSELFHELAQMDSILFTAFNSRNIDRIKTLFTTDLEFYHDKGGLFNYNQNNEALQSMFEGETKVRRELVSGSLEVFPVKDYGAIQTGEHRFYNTEKGQPEQLGGKFKFLHIWKKENGVWKIARVVSYDH